jgi:Ras family protein
MTLHAHPFSIGKSALTSQFMFGDFPTAYHPTRADSFNKIVDLDGASYNVDVLDTAGQESYAAVPQMLFLP